MESLTYWYKLADMEQSEYDQIKTFGTSPDGNFYGFPAYMDAAGDKSMYNTNINHVWLDKLGLSMPTTTDEFYNVLVAFRDNDPNGNGQKDEIPFLTGPQWNGNTWQELINAFVFYNPTYLFNVTDGKLWAPVVTEEYREALRYIKKLVSEGLMSPLSFSITGEEQKAAVNLTPDQDTVVGVIGSLPLVIFDSENEKTYEYDALPTLTGPAGVSWSPNRTANFQFSTFITKECKYPEIAFRMMDYWWEEKRSLITRYGEPGVHWDYYLDSADFTTKYPYLGYASTALGLDSAKHTQVPGVENPWTSSEPHNSIWTVHFCCGLPISVYSATASTSPVPTTWTEAKEKGWGVAAHRNYISLVNFQDKSGRQPSELVTRLVYTDEENTATAEIRTSVHNYIAECIALFATGAMDIEKDWDRYVKDLEDMGLAEYTATAQAAYDRMYK